jgi:hypothetical protein
MGRAKPIALLVVYVVALCVASVSRASGAELAYAEITANVTVASTTAATPTSVVDAGSVTYAASTPIVVEFSAPLVTSNCSCAEACELEDGGSVAGTIWQTGANSGLPAYGARRFAPSAGSHDYSIGCYRQSGSGSVVVNPGNSSGTNPVPAFIRITLADGGGGTAGPTGATGPAGPTGATGPAGPAGSGGSGTLAGLSDVALSGTANHDVLTYSAGTAKWTNGTLPASTCGGVGQAACVVSMGADDASRLDLSWWGTWLLCGLVVCLLVLPSFGRFWGRIKT